MSRGQRRRNILNFPAMNDRAGRRRHRRAVKRARRIAETITGRPHTYYNKGGFIGSTKPIRFRLVNDEWVVTDREWRCYRTDPAHVATARHRAWNR
ncbi:hypothetical protein NDR87_30040 [Nocardia sp. CDC159]|uniref:Uncharacterized protein n=1 Tax=Nocardia pulmonis TaxID=2951408 RepID=A0A9X2EGG7_9NOCA|nr:MULTISPECIES: hypothetical protein [Nocardia]MCM6777733.1 hypothetical protein [Nocardia pulmonis]MCM6790618.1 hypothetical protein [Nocardia sp. CDC159]